MEHVLICFQALHGAWQLGHVLKLCSAYRLGSWSYSVTPMFLVQAEPDTQVGALHAVQKPRTHTVLVQPPLNIPHTFWTCTCHLPVSGSFASEEGRNIIQENKHSINAPRGRNNFWIALSSQQNKRRCTDWHKRSVKFIGKQLDNKTDELQFC